MLMPTPHTDGADGLGVGCIDCRQGAAPWTDSEADVLATGFDVKNGEIDTTASKFTLRDNDGTERIKSENGRSAGFCQLQGGRERSVKATNGNFSGAVHCEQRKNRKSGNQERIGSIGVPNSGSYNVLSPRGIQFHTSLSDRICFVRCPCSDHSSNRGAGVTREVPA